MTPEKLESFSVKSEHMHPEMLFDLLEKDIGNIVTLDYPNSAGEIHISEIPVEEVEKVITIVRNGGGEILEN